MFRLPNSRFYSPDDANGVGGAADKALGIEDTLDILNETDDDAQPLDLTKSESDKPDTTVKKTDGSGKDEEETLDLEAEIEKELADEVIDEDKLELVVPSRRKDILAKYPDLFKNFPSIEKAIYREQAFSEIIPTLDDAKEAVANSELLNKFGQQLAAGDSVEILKTTKDANPEGFAKLVDNYLPNLYKADPGAYFVVTGNVISHAVTEMIKQGKASNNSDLIAAAEIVNDFIFAQKEIRQQVRMSAAESRESNPKENELSQREQEFQQREFDSHYNTLDTKISNVLVATIDKNIDPNESMSGYVKKNATREVREEVTSALEKDTRFQTVMGRLWDRAAQEGYSKESLDRINSAFLSKAKTLLPDAIKKARNEALKGLGKKSPDSDKRGHLPVGQTRRTAAPNTSGKTGGEKGVVPKGVSTLDFLNQD